jgi:hypothetical protein
MLVQQRIQPSSSYDAIRGKKCCGVQGYVSIVSRGHTKCAECNAYVLIASRFFINI